MSPNIKFNVKITGNPLIDGMILKVVGYVAAAVAAHAILWMKNHGFDVTSMEQTTLIEFIGGGFISGIVLVLGWIKNKQDMAKAAQGALNLVMSGEAVTEDGTKITSIGAPGSTPPKPVTPATAVQIAKLAK